MTHTHPGRGSWGPATRTCLGWLVINLEAAWEPHSATGPGAAALDFPNPIRPPAGATSACSSEPQETDCFGAPRGDRQGSGNI